MIELLDRIKHFEDHCIETNNPEGAEVLHYSANRIKDLELQLAQTEWGSTYSLLSEVISAHSDPESCDYNECDIPSEECMWCTEAKKVLQKLEPLPSNPNT